MSSSSSSSSSSNASLDEDTTLFLSTAKTTRCKVHPVVLFSILDHFVRRKEGQQRVVGTLLGKIRRGRCIEITDCFAVPHSDDDEMGSLDVGYHRSMVEMHKKASPNETVVGWYTTGNDLDARSVYFHNFYWRDMHRSPVLLRVATDLKHQESMQLHAYVANPLTFAESLETSLGAQFERVELTVSSFDSEKIGLDLLLQSATSNDAAAPPGQQGGDAPRKATALLSDVDTLRTNLRNLLALLDDVAAYVDAVVDGSVAPDPKIGRFLASAVSSLPTIEPDSFSELFSHTVQDILMVNYLTNLARANLAVARRIELQHAQIK
jgi:translation initiation factor 3 subunit F